MDSRIIKNTLSLGAIQAANALLPLLAFPYLIRVLGMNDFGVIMFAQAVVAYVVLVADYGFNLTGAAKIASAKGRGEGVAQISAVFWNIQFARIVLAGSASVALALVVTWVPSLRAISGVVAASWLAVLGTLLFPRWMFQGLERLTLSSVAQIAARLATLAALFVWVQDENDMVLAAGINAVAPVVAGLVSIALLAHSKEVVWVRPRWSGAVSELRESWHVFISVLATNVYTTSNAVILGFLANNSAVAFFALADKLKQGCSQVMSPLSSAVFPRVNMLRQKDEQQAFAMLRKLFGIQVTLGAVLSLVLFFGAPIIYRLMTGHVDEEGVLTLKWMAFVPLFVSVSNILGVHLMVSFGHHRAFSRILIACGVFNVVLVAMVSGMHGAPGATAVTLFIEGLVVVLMTVSLKQAGLMSLVLAGRGGGR